jgi:hypothetical protein
MVMNNETETAHNDKSIIFLFNIHSLTEPNFTLSSWGDIQRRRINYNVVVKYFNMSQL